MTWSAASHEAEYRDAEGKEFKILAARTRHTAALVKEQPKYDDRYREIPPDGPAVVFRTDEEVLTYLSKRATHVCVKASDLFRYRTANNKYVDKDNKNIELPDDIPDIDDRDEALWTVYAAKQLAIQSDYRKLPFTAAEQVAKEFLLADGKLLTITKQVRHVGARQGYDD